MKDGPSLGGAETGDGNKLPRSRWSLARMQQVAQRSREGDPRQGGRRGRCENRFRVRKKQNYGPIASRLFRADGRWRCAAPQAARPMAREGARSERWLARPDDADGGASWAVTGSGFWGHGWLGGYMPHLFHSLSHTHA